MFKLTVATVEDYPVVAEMARDFYSRTTQAQSIPYDEETAYQLFLDLVANGFVVLAWQDEEPIGMLGCMMTPAMLNKNFKVATEIFWWVDPLVRGGKAAIQMLAAAEYLAKVEGAKIITMGTLDTSPQGLGKFYERRGYARQEESYVKVL